MRVGHRTGARAAGDSRGKEGKKGFGFIGVQSPEAKEWSAKFPWGGGSWGAKSPVGGDLVVPPELGAGLGSKARQRVPTKIGWKSDEWGRMFRRGHGGA